MRLCRETLPNDAHLADGLKKTEQKNNEPTNKQTKKKQPTEFQHFVVSGIEIFDFTTS